MALIKTYTTDYGFDARADFASLAEAQAFADSFPKSYRVKAQEYRDYKATPGSAVAIIRYSLNPKNGSTENPAGVGRATRFMDKAEKLGHTFEHHFR